jgi:hypothetical protein
MMKKPEVKNNKNGQNGKKKGPHKKQGGRREIEAFNSNPY